MAKSDSSSDSDSSDNDADSGLGKRRPVWHDEDDEDFTVQDKTATYQIAIGKHGKKEFSKENYAKSLRKQFSTLTDTPKWADLNTKALEDSDDEFFRVRRILA